MVKEINQIFKVFNYKVLTENNQELKLVRVENKKHKIYLNINKETKTSEKKHSFKPLFLKEKVTVTFVSIMEQNLIDTYFELLTVSKNDALNFINTHLIVDKRGEQKYE